MLAPEEVKDALAPLRNDFSIALAAPGNAFAVGAIIRVAHSYLAREVFVVGAGDWYPKASMGMQKYETVVRVPDAGGPARGAGGDGRSGRSRKTARGEACTRWTGFPAGRGVRARERAVRRARGGRCDRADEVLGIPSTG